VRQRPRVEGRQVSPDFEVFLHRIRSLVPFRNALCYAKMPEK
jgi:hypothetical protein